MCSVYSKGKSVAAERFIRTLKNKIYKHRTSISKNVYIDNLDDAVNQHNNRCHRIINMKPVDVKSGTQIDFNKENNQEGPKVKVDDYERIPKYKNIFAKGCVPNWCEEVLVIKKAKNIVPWTYVISDVKGEEIVRMFNEQKLQNK